MKDEALKLADESQRQSSLVYLVADEPIAKQMSQMFLNYSAMIRRLVEELSKLEKDLALKTRDRDVFCNFTLAYEKRIEELEKLEQDFIRVIKQTNPNKPQTKPLSDEEIGEIYWKLHSDDWTEEDIKFARAIEERHGIK